MNSTTSNLPEAVAVQADAAPMPDSAARVLRQFRLVFNAVKSHFRQVEKVAGIGGAQLWALSIVALQPGIGVNALARAMDIQQTTASNLVRALAEADMLAVERKAEDRRVVQLRLLPAGDAVLQRAPGPFSGVLPAAIAQLDTAALARLEADLAQLIALLRPDSNAASVPLAQL
jgi:DNA-binding MarR family transcriptional regulator